MSMLSLSGLRINADSGKALTCRDCFENDHNAKWLSRVSILIEKGRYVCNFALAVHFLKYLSVFLTRAS